MIDLLRSLALALALAGCMEQQARDAPPIAAEEPSAQEDTSFVLFEVEPSESTDHILEVASRRLERSEFVRAPIERQDLDRLRVGTAGMTPEQVDRMVALLTRPGVLSFNMVDVNADPAGYEIGEEKNGRVALPDDSLDGQSQVIFTDAIVRGADFAVISQSRDVDSDRPSISFQLHARAAEKFGRATSHNVGRPFAIVIDNRIVSHPYIMSPILSGMGMITADYTEEEAKDLAAVLGGGALPGKLMLLERVVP